MYLAPFFNVQRQRTELLELLHLRTVAVNLRDGGRGLIVAHDGALDNR